MIELFHDTGHACSRLATERYSSSFSRAIRVLHRDLRSPVYDVYGFVRFADEIVDSFHGLNKRELLAEFKAETYKAISRGISLNPILNSFQLTVNTYQIPHDLIDAFFESMEMDLEGKNYDREGYEKYIYGSAESVGLMCLQIFCNGNKPDYERLRPAARALGAAFQKINFLRDVKADHETLERTYFPGVNFKQFTRQDKQQIETDIARDLAQARAGIEMLPEKARFGVYLAYKYYVSLFRKIRRAKPDGLLRKRIRINNGFKALIFLKAGFRNSINLL